MEVFDMISEKMYEVKPFADLSGIEINSVDFTGMDLHGVNFQNSMIDDCYLDNANLSSADLSNATISNCRLIHADLSNAILQGTRLNTSLYGATFKTARFEGCYMMRNWHEEEVIYARFNQLKLYEYWQIETIKWITSRRFFHWKDLDGFPTFISEWILSVASTWVQDIEEYGIPYLVQNYIRRNNL